MLDVSKRYMCSILADSSIDRANALKFLKKFIVEDDTKGMDNFAVCLDPIFNKASGYRLDDINVSNYLDMVQFFGDCLVGARFLNGIPVNTLFLPRTTSALFYKQLLLTVPAVRDDCLFILAYFIEHYSTLSDKFKPNTGLSWTRRKKLTDALIDACKSKGDLASNLTS
jgi:hypothetical protein